MRTSRSHGSGEAEILNEGTVTDQGLRFLSGAACPVRFGMTMKEASAAVGAVAATAVEYVEGCS
jgi:hypothetical protein